MKIKNHRQLISFKYLFLLLGTLIFIWFAYIEVVYTPAQHGSSYWNPPTLLERGIVNVPSSFIFVMGLVFGKKAVIDIQALPVLYNAIEVVLWGTIGLWLVMLNSLRGGYYRNCGLLIGFFFLSFAITDGLEIETGAWWSPWWLLIWKILNITGFLIGYIQYKKIKNILENENKSEIGTAA